MLASDNYKRNTVKFPNSYEWWVIFALQSEENRGASPHHTVEEKSKANLEAVDLPFAFSSLTFHFHILKIKGCWLPNLCPALTFSEQAQNTVLSKADLPLSFFSCLNSPFLCADHNYACFASFARLLWRSNEMIDVKVLSNGIECAEGWVSDKTQRHLCSSEVERLQRIQ